MLSLIHTRPLITILRLYSDIIILINRKVDFWKSPSKVGGPVDMLVSPDKQGPVLQALQRHMFEVEVTVEDLQRDIDEERASAQSTFSYTDFNTLATVSLVVFGTLSVS